jgi:hypothetical protein
MDILNDLFAQIFSMEESTTSADRIAAARTFLADVPPAELTPLLEAATAAFAQASPEGDAVPGDEQLAEMERVADVVQAVRELRDEFSAAEAARIAKAKELAARLAPAGNFGGKDDMKRAAAKGGGKAAKAAKSGGNGSGGDGSGDDSDGDDSDDSGDGGDGGSGNGDDDDSGGAPPKGKNGKYKKKGSASARTASTGKGKQLAARKPAKVQLGQMPSTLPPRGQRTVSVAASADVPGFSAGGELPSMRDMAEAVRAKMRTLESSGSPYLRQGIISIRRNPDPAFTCTGSQDDWIKIENASDEKRLPGGSLIASNNALTAAAGGGWCAPSEILYELCPTASMDGLVDLPGVTLTRGGVRWPQTPDFSAVYGIPQDGGTGVASGTAPTSPLWTLTEAGVSGLPTAGNVKPCYEVPCPPFQEKRLDVIGLCLKAGILTNQAYPELVQYFLEQSLIAHAHHVNAQTLTRMAAQSCKFRFAVTAGSAGTGGVGATPDIYPGFGASSGILDIVELQALDMRYRYRWAQTDTLELVLPIYAKGLVRADIAKRFGIQDPFNVDDDLITTWLALRGVSVQWVYDFFDAFNPTIPAYDADFSAQFGTECPADITSGLPTGTMGIYPTPTASSPLVANVKWPSMVPGILYKAGTFIKGQADVITIDGLYDSTTLAQNRYTALFMEEGLLVGKKCWESRLLLIDACPNGQTGGSIVPPTTVCPV